MTTHKITSQNYGICMMHDALATVEQMPKKKKIMSSHMEHPYILVTQVTSGEPMSKSWANLGVDPLGPKEQNVQTLSLHVLYVPLAMTHDP